VGGDARRYDWILRGTRHFEDAKRKVALPPFCLLDYDAEGRTSPLLAVIDGAAKPYRTTLAKRRYAKVRELGAEYLRRNPRSLTTEDEVRAAIGTT
jgi:hypothetical protein